MSSNRKNGRKTGRNADGTFGPGNSGKPKGARHKATLAAEALLNGEAEALTRKAIELALGGDVTAIRLCLERIAPPRRDRPVSFELPKMTNSSDGVLALSAAMSAVAAGELTPEEGLNIAKLIEAQRRVIETEVLEKRLTELEATMRRR